MNYQNMQSQPVQNRPARPVNKKGLGLLAEHFPENVRLVVKHRAGWKGEEEP